MRAAVVNAANDVAVVDVPNPADDRNADAKALVAVSHAGMCGTDVKVATGAIPVAYPRVMGHELVGTVLRSSRLPEGTRVVLDPVQSCRHCVQCLADNTHLCANGGLMGREIDGGFAEFVAVDELQLHAVPDAVPDEEAMIVQVLGTCFHAQTLVDVWPDQTAVVVGLGVSGLLHVQLLVARGLRVIGVTRSQWKLDLATKMGAYAVATPDQAQDLVNDITGGRGADLVVESVGAANSLIQSIQLAGLGAKVLLFGIVTASKVDIPWYPFYVKELNLIQSRAARPRDYARAMDMVAKGQLDVKPLLSKSYPLSDIDGALESFNDSSNLKVWLTI